ncbi:MAG: hypothetical protein ACM3OA_02645 [Acidobacteriota bacterium]
MDFNPPTWQRTTMNRITSALIASVFAVSLGAAAQTPAPPPASTPAPAAKSDTAPMAKAETKHTSKKKKHTSKSKKKSAGGTKESMSNEAATKAK